MVDWSGFSGSIDVPKDYPKEHHEFVKVKVTHLNKEYFDKICEILNLAVSFEKDEYVHELTTRVTEIKVSYESTGVLTKDEMLFLNRAYKILVFESKFHKDKQTTIGLVYKLLGELNES